VTTAHPSRMHDSCIAWGDAELKRRRRTMDRDFVYCPGCARYSVVQFKPELMGWECEDCTYTQPMDEEPVWMASATLGS
jgi:hypothetical protein